MLWIIFLYVTAAITYNIVIKHITTCKTVIGNIVRNADFFLLFRWRAPVIFFNIRTTRRISGTVRPGRRDLFAVVAGARNANAGGDTTTKRTAWIVTVLIASNAGVLVGFRLLLGGLFFFFFYAFRTVPILREINWNAKKKKNLIIILVCGAYRPARRHPDNSGRSGGTSSSSAVVISHTNKYPRIIIIIIIVRVAVLFSYCNNIMQRMPVRAVRRAIAPRSRPGHTGPPPREAKTSPAVGYVLVTGGYPAAREQSVIIILLLL